MKRSAVSPSTSLGVNPEDGIHGQRSVGQAFLPVFLASLLLCLFASASARAQKSENVAHQQYLGLVADPANLVKGSTFYRSDLDTLRVRAGDVQFWDGSAWSSFPRPASGLFSRLNSIRIVEPTLWPGGTVTADIDAAITDCASLVCLALYPSSLGVGEATTIPENATVLDLRQTALVPFPPSISPRIPGLLLRRRLTNNPAINFSSLVGLYVDLDAASGGAYDSTTKETYTPYNGQLWGRTKGQHIFYGGRVDGFGIGDALLMGGAVYGWGGKVVTGTSQPTAEFAEIIVKTGYLVFTAQVSGDPASGATAITYASDTNEAVLGERALINTSQTTTSGTVSSIATDTVTFAGAPDWTTLTPSPIGQYFKVNADDVTIGGTSTGHWYRVIARTATTLQLETTYDADLTTSGAYTLAQGAEITAFNTTTNVLTIESNSYDWAAANTLISPPMPLLNFRGLVLLLDRLFESGTSRAINISNTGPFPWDVGILIEGAPATENAFTSGVIVAGKVNDAFRTDTATIAGTALRMANDHILRWGANADFKFTASGSLFLFNKGGRFESASASITPLTLKQTIVSPTADYLTILNSTNGTIFSIDDSPDGQVNVKCAFGTGVKLDPAGPTVGACGVNTNIVLDLITKGTGTVRVNAQNSTGTGGFAVYDGAATSLKMFSVSATGVGPNDRGFKHGRVSTGSVGAGAAAAVTLTWTTAFADTNYTVNCSVQEAAASTSTLRVHHIESVAAGSVVVRVVNDDGANPKTGTLHCTAVHD